MRKVQQEILGLYHPRNHMTKTPTVPTVMKSNKQRSRNSSTTPSLPSPTQHLLHTYFAPTSVPTLDPLQTSRVAIVPTTQQCSNSTTTFAIPPGPPTSQRVRSKAAKRSHDTVLSLDTYLAPTTVPTVETTQAVLEQSIHNNNTSFFNDVINLKRPNDLIRLRLW